MHTINNPQAIVIGAGPGGGTAAMYLARFNHRVLLLDASKKVRARTSWAHGMENIPGFTGEISGKKFLESLNQQVEKFGVDRREELVVAVSQDSQGNFEVRTEVEVYRAKYLIVAVGVHDVLPNILGIEQYLGFSVFPCPTCNWYQTKDRPTAIVARDDHGLLMARMFTALQKGSVVCVVPEKSDVNFSTELVEKIEAEGVRVYSSPLRKLQGTPKDLAGLELIDGTTIPIEILYTKLGIIRLDTFLDVGNLDIQRAEKGCIEVDFKTYESSVSNLFAIGPCNTGEDQVVVSAGQGVIAAVQVHERILSEQGI